jgi:SAM-dependent methyltransferase
MSCTGNGGWPAWARRESRRVAREGADLVRRYPCMPLRRAMAKGQAAWVSRLPDSLRTRLDLNGGRVNPLRVEIGPGGAPTTGYVHVDSDRRARHLEHVAPAWDLPFDDASVEEILAVHVLEHVHPSRVERTLLEWRRVLVRGGLVRIHVPNAPLIFERFVTGDDKTKWALMNAILGLYGGPEIAAPKDIDASREPDHRALYDFDLLADLLAGNGFSPIENLTGRVEDRHTLSWGFPFSIVVHARAA